MTVVNRFFFALRPPRTVARRMALEAERHDPGGQHVRIDRLHMTVGILDDLPSVPRDLVPALRAVGEGVAVDPFPCLFDRVVGGRGIVTLRPGRRSKSLTALFGQIEAGLRNAGLGLREGYGFSPHVTLSYRAGGEPFSAALQGYGWLVEDVLLIHSLVGQTEHRELGRWPLRGGSGSQLSLF